MRINILPLSILFSIVFLTFSCRRSVDDDVELDTSFTNNEIIAELSFEDIDKVADEVEFTQVVKSSPNTNITILGCGTVDTLRINGDTLQVTIDFGAQNCLGTDGKNRRGKLIVTRAGNYFSGDSYYREVHTEGYFVNDNGVELNRKITLSDTTLERHRIYLIAMEGTVTLANGNGEIRRVSDRRRTWFEGMETRLDKMDDAYKIEGSLSGTHTDGRTYVSTVAEPLYKRVSCDYTEKGVLNFTPEGKVTRVIDFGNGECDNKATVSIGGVKADILLD
jgi:hypothetical protein